MFDHQSFAMGSTEARLNTSVPGQQNLNAN